MNFTHGGNVFAIARSLGVAPKEILDFSASINPLGPAPGVKEAVAAAWDSIVHYPESDATELTEAVAQLHGLSPENICVANGSTELIYLIPRLVPGKRALIIAPPFSEYAKALQQHGWQVDYFILSPEDDFNLDLQRLDMELSKGYDLLFLCNPGNPTGRLYPLADVSELIHICRQRNVFLVLDEAFMDFCEEESAKSLLLFESSGGDLLILRSMTKFYALPGLRLGYAMGHPNPISRLTSVRIPWSVNTLAQVAGIASLVDADYRRRTVEYIIAERKHLAESLATIPGIRIIPSAANYVLLQLPACASSLKVQEAILHHRILVRSCDNFVGLSDCFLRLAVRSREENRLLSKVLEQVLTATTQ